MGGMLASTVALRAQIVSTLSERAVPLSTDELLKLVHPGMCATGGRCPYLRRYEPPCPGHCWKPRLYTSLRALERRQVVMCTRPAGSYAVFWSAAPDPTDEQMDELLEALGRDSPDDVPG